MFWTYLGNGAMGFILIVAFIFSVPSIDDALNDPTGYPFLYVFQQAMPSSGVICMSVLMLVLLVVGDISYQASTARQTFAFARDKGLPFHRWIARVSPPLKDIYHRCTILNHCRSTRKNTSRSTR